MATQPDIVDDGEMLFRSFVDASEELREFWRRCTKHPAFFSEQVLLTSDFRRYTSGSTLELYVDCEAKSGRAFAWCTDVRRKKLKWTVERTVKVNVSGGQRTLLELTSKEFSSSRTLALELPRLVKELAATLDELDLDAA